MKIVAIICRVLLGLGFVIFGLNGFLHFMPMAPHRRRILSSASSSPP